MHYVYILQSLKDRNLYYGYTHDIQKRVREHNAKENNATKGRVPFKLVYYEAYSSMKDARKREQNLKLQSNALGQLKRRISSSLLLTQ